jgi:hypothetical protein
MVRLGRFHIVGVWLVLMPWTAPVLAHNVRVSGDVAATFHIEPHHNPKTGRPSQAWFALTHRGGETISLTRCSCKLKVYLNPHQEEDGPLLVPVLKALSTEQYQGIPSAEIIFPKAGAYVLEISGTPKAGATFQPFKLSYEVTVTGGAIPDAKVQPKQEQSIRTNDAKAAATPKKLKANSPSDAFNWLMIAPGVSAIALATAGYILLRRLNPKK